MALVCLYLVNFVNTWIHFHVDFVKKKKTGFIHLARHMIVLSVKIVAHWSDMGLSWKMLPCNVKQVKMVFFSTAYFAAIVFLWECTMCIASVQTTKTQLSKGKIVATSYMTLKSYSDIRCVRNCFEEKRQGRCSVAGYDKSTQTCFLSNDGPEDLVDADEKFGVFLFSEREGMFGY